MMLLTSTAVPHTYRLSFMYILCMFVSPEDGPNLGPLISPYESGLGEAW
jgi:hypothetical protein